MVSTANKQHLRTLFTQYRDSLPTIRHQEGEKKFAQYVSTLPKNAVILSYISFHSELSSRLANQQILQNTKQIVLPKIIDTTSMLPLLITSSHILEAQQHPGHLQTPQNIFIDVKDITHALIPGLAFDQKFFRLGLGKGYYDRWLAQNPHVISIGIGFREQYIPQLPIQPHDIAMQKVLLF